MPKEDERIFLRHFEMAKSPSSKRKKENVDATHTCVCMYVHKQHQILLYSVN